MSKSQTFSGDILDQILNGKPIAGLCSNATSAAATGTITFAVNPSANDTITLNGTAVTFVAAGATGNQVDIGADLASTLTALQTFLAASADAQISKCNYSASTTVLTVTNKTAGFAGNSFTLAASAATVSSATLTGGQDAALTQVWAGLATADPGTNGNQSTNECTYTPYARVSLSRDPNSPLWTIDRTVSPATATLTANKLFNQCTATVGGVTETATHLVIGTDQVGAGKKLWSGELDIPISINVGVQPELEVGTVVDEQ